VSDVLRTPAGTPKGGTCQVAASRAGVTTPLASTRGRPPHTPATRDLAIRALLAGTPIRELSRELGIGRNTLKRWRFEARVDPGDPDVTRPVSGDLGPAITDLIHEEIAAVRALCRLVRDPRWARRQPAGQLALLADRLAERLYQLLAAVRTDDPERDQEQGIRLGVEPAPDGPSVARE
jgi:transposase-like protein